MATLAERMAPARYAGWLRGLRETAATLDSYRIENVVEFESGWAELGRYSWSRSLETSWHTGRGYFLTLILDGPAELERRNLAVAGTGQYGGTRMYLVPPDQTIHVISTEQGDARSMRFFINADYVEAICAVKPSGAERAALGAVDFSGGTIDWLLLRMYREICSTEAGVAIVVESISREIAVEIAREIERRRHRTDRQRGGLPPWRMRLLQDRIYSEDPLPTVAELADICGMTVRHLSRAFHAETGRTLGKFITAAMAERASKMLEAGAPVGVVAAILGYASSSSFAHAFHRETGALPSSIRDKRRAMLN